MNESKNVKPARILLIEDSAADAELARYEIRKCEEVICIHSVATLPEVSKALYSDWSAIVCDFRLPGFTAYDVLQKVRALSTRLPFIVISHEINDADSARLFEAGADDVLSKTHLSRLSSILKRRIQCSVSFQAPPEADHATVQNEMNAHAFANSDGEAPLRLFAAITGQGKHGVVIVDPEGKIEYANENAERILLLSRNDITRHYYHDRTPWRQIDRNRRTLPIDELPLSQALQNKIAVQGFVHGIVLPDGETRWLSVSASPVHGPDGRLISAVASFEDVSSQLK